MAAEEKPSEQKQDTKWPLYKKLYVFGLPFTVYLTIKHGMWTKSSWLEATAIILGVFFFAIFLDLYDEHKRERARMNANNEAGITGLEAAGLYFLVRLLFNFQAVACFVIAFILTIIWWLNGMPSV